MMYGGRLFGQLFHEMHQQDVKPNAFTYTTLIDISGKVKKVDMALQLFHEMKQQGLQPSKATYRAVQDSLK